MRNFRGKIALLLIALLLFTSNTAFATHNSPQTVLVVGDYGGEVMALQGRLKSIGLYEGEPDGLFDLKTQGSVLHLQRLLNVAADGKYGPVTHSAYVAALKEHILNPLFTEALPDKPLLLSGRIVGIDPGHQAVSDNALERVSPNNELLKPRMSSGAIGVKTGAQEAAVNLSIALKLKALLENAGARVIMSRTTHDVSVSNIERAQLMNEAGVDLWLRLHCDASSDANVSGALALVPSPVETPSIYEKSNLLGALILQSFCEATGAASLGVVSLSNQTGFNWSSRPVVTIEAGHLSNAFDDVRLNRDSYQNSCAKGILNGVAQYFLALESGALS